MMMPPVPCAIWRASERASEWCPSLCELLLRAAGVRGAPPSRIRPAGAINPGDEHPPCIREKPVSYCGGTYVIVVGKA